MAAGDNTIVKFQAGDETDADTQLQALAPVSGDKVISWQWGNLIYVAKIATS